MKKTIIGFALLTLAAGFSSACGGDDSSKTTSKAGTGGGGSGGAGPVYCAKETCKAPDGMPDAVLCCMDAFKGGCGIMSGGSCRKPPAPADDRCPLPQINVMIPGAGGTSGSATGGFVVVGCCSDKNECGVDFGMGCTARSALCSYIPKSAASGLTAMTCDGSPIDLPANCGTDITIPNFGGSGGSN